MKRTEKLASYALVAAGLMALGGVARAEDKITCDPNAKKLEWHMCLQDAVEYKRGMKTEKRDECKVDKIVKLTNGCDFGDLYKHVPAGADLGKVRFYAIGPEGMDTRDYEAQGEPNITAYCAISPHGSLAGWEMMKFSDAFDKSNSERAGMFKDGLKKKKKMLMSQGVTVRLGQDATVNTCNGSSAKMGILDKKTLSKYLVYATIKFPAPAAAAAPAAAEEKKE